jgi:lipopolysaccharide assembly outer membrane protein LptD (OstA)
MNRNIPILFLVAASGVALSANAQQPAPVTSPTDTAKVVNILHADRLGFSKKDTANPIQYGAGNVAAQQNKTLFYSDSAVLAQKTKIFQAYGHVHSNDADSTHLWGLYAVSYRYQDGLYAKK